MSGGLASTLGLHTQFLQTTITQPPPLRASQLPLPLTLLLLVAALMVVAARCCCCYGLDSGAWKKQK